MNKKLITIVVGISLVILIVTLGIGKLISKRSFHRLKMTSDRVDAIYQYGLIQYSQKDFDKAIKAFEIIASQTKDTKKKEDALFKLAEIYKQRNSLLKKSNNLKTDIIIPKRTLKIAKSKFTIFVDKSQNLLFLKKDNQIVKTYKVSTGINNSTPVGKFRIEEKLISPVWYKVGAVVPPDSPEYELGKYWMGISVKGYGIHGTNDPASIGKQITKGCIRMLNKDIEELYIIVPSGTKVTIAD